MNIEKKSLFSLWNEIYSRHCPSHTGETPSNTPAVIYKKIVSTDSNTFVKKIHNLKVNFLKDFPLCDWSLNVNCTLYKKVYLRTALGYIMLPPCVSMFVPIDALNLANCGVFPPKRSPYFGRPYTLLRLRRVSRALQLYICGMWCQAAKKKVQSVS